MEYKFTENTQFFKGVMLREIESIDGQAGGFLESEKNLSQTGTAWVHPSGKVYGNASVVEDAQIFGVVNECAAVRGSAQVHGTVAGTAVIADHAQIFGSVSGAAFVGGNTVVPEGVEVNG